MCEQHPLHNDEDVIAGKIWLIGRAYSAAIERKAGDNIVEGENFYAAKVAPMIRASDLDGWIKSVRHIERVTVDNVEQVLSVHKNFTDLLKDITGIEKRSLASKYLHFHLPNAFFIFDSVANKELRKRLKGRRFKYPKEYDDAYAAFVVRCLEFRNTVLERTGKRNTHPRELDKLLLGY